MSDIVLVYPKASFMEKAMNKLYLPLAFLSCSVFLAKDYSIKIIDQRVSKNWKKELIKELKTSPKCVGLSTSTGEQIGYALEISKFVKDYSNTPIIWGGPHPTILPEQTLKNQYIDYVIEGEGEIAFHEFIKYLNGDLKIEEVHNLWYKTNGLIKNNPLAKLVDLNTLPQLPYHLVNISNYILSYGNKKMLILEGSRGCPNRCKFCFVNKSSSQRVWRALTPQNLFDQIVYLKDRYNIDGVEFQDLSSFVDINRIIEFSNIVIQNKLKIFWNTCGRIDDLLKLGKEGIDLLEKSGLKRLSVGIESGSEKILEMINKKLTLDQIYKISKLLNHRRIDPYYSFIIGFPRETKSQRDETRKLILYLLKENKNAKVSLLHCYRPLPGNELYEMCKELGLKEPKSLKDWSKFHTTQINFPWLSKKAQIEIKKLNFLSMFLDKKYLEIDKKMVRFFAFVYGPIARFRFKHKLLGGLLALKLKDLYLHISS
jgi:radical SAM superfamily enzyme YgiQ (UPF0313 family)